MENSGSMLLCSFSYQDMKWGKQTQSTMQNNAILVVIRIIGKNAPTKNVNIVDAFLICLSRNEIGQNII